MTVPSRNKPRVGILTQRTVLLALAVMAGCGTGHDSAQKAPETRPAISGLGLETVAVTAMPETVDVVGTVRARTSALVSTRIPGVVSVLKVREGDRVRKGQILMQLDGILLGLLLLESMAVSGKGLRQMLDETMDEIGHFHYRRIDRRIEDAAKQELICRLSSAPPSEIDGHRVAGTNFSDGFKFMFENGDWLLIRPSGTEPVLRLYSEAGSPAQVDRFLRAASVIADG